MEKERAPRERREGVVMDLVSGRGKGGREIQGELVVLIVSDGLMVSMSDVVVFGLE